MPITAREALISHADKMEWLIHTCAVLVAIGLMIEIIQIYLEKRNAKKIDLLITLIGPVFVGLGVAGEVYFGLKSSESHRAIRAIDDKEIALTQRLITQIRMPRALYFRAEVFAENLRKYKPIQVAIYYLPENQEARQFAYAIKSGLDIVRWPSTPPLATPSNVICSNLHNLTPQVLSTMTSSEKISCGTSGGQMTLVAGRDTGEYLEHIASALFAGIEAGKLHSLSLTNAYNPDLPPKSMIIVVNEKQ